LFLLKVVGGSEVPDTLKGGRSCFNEGGWQFLLGVGAGGGDQIAEIKEVDAY